MNKEKQITYSQALTELEQIIAEAESEGIEVDALAEKVKRAAFLIKGCKDKLRSADEEVKKALAGLEDVTEEG